MRLVRGKPIAYYSVAATGLLALATLPACQTTGGDPVYYRGAVTDHFDGEHFFNPDGEQGTGGSQRDGKKRFVSIAVGKDGHHTWPAHVPVKQSVPPARVQADAMRVTWVGHATTLVQTQGLNILFDPVWAERDSPVQVAGPKRVRQPGVALRDLPKIDLILLSHNHYDHMDVAALKWIDKRDRPRIVVPLGNETILKDHGLHAEPQDWSGRVAVRPGIDLILTRAHHWSARWTNDHDRALWSGFVLTLPGGNLYYAGDTGAGDMKWAAAARAYGPIRFAILPIGPYHVDAPDSGNHIGPEQAVTAFQQSEAAFALGVHWGTFELSDEPIDGPPTLLQQYLGAEHIAPERFRTLEAGGFWDVPLVPDDPQ
jgi:L-ascorbate metabolism protein UlaG (beta-lactamase superfamily)